MFEELIVSLDGMGVHYTEDYDAGSLTIDIADVDKTQLIDVLQQVTDGGLPFTIDASSIVVSGGQPVETPDEPEEEESSDAGALEDMLGNM